MLIILVIVSTKSFFDFSKDHHQFSLFHVLIVFFGVILSTLAKMRDARVYYLSGGLSHSLSVVSAGLEHVEVGASRAKKLVEYVYC